jgi:hypothetical protein
MGLACPACGKDQKDALSTEQFAKLAGLLPETVANLCQDGKVPAEKVHVSPRSSVWRIPITEAVVRVLNKYRAQAPKRR